LPTAELTSRTASGRLFGTPAADENPISGFGLNELFCLVELTYEKRAGCRCFP
jgi:hypothetical protein